MMGIVVERATVNRWNVWTLVLRDQERRRTISGWRFTKQGSRRRVAKLIEQSQKWSSLKAWDGREELLALPENVIPFAKRKPQPPPHSGGVGGNPPTGAS